MKEKYYTENKIQQSVKLNLRINKLVDLNI